MITCPLCQHLVHWDNNGDTNIHLVTGDTSDFYCPTYVDVHHGVRWAHYSRRHITNSNELKYIAIIPPFEIWWTDQEHYLLVKQFGIDPTNYRINKVIYEETNVSPEELTKIYQRFTNLRAFS